ncbi:glycosyltransferase involved in cell wall biosynthesis [Stenotrophomonas rhizophila]|uniref:Glycosyltransferase involved in cell wall biosynthesis n=1 Tax=Stenotrophomonas rhizophila TaxID=216778 RepID=A0AAP5AJN0_9GAMM|nr:glycosyltransferase [Stenotrophomonas rhizophila]MDQ1109932.1 glycosyltransferase involved in cell wall biosynthesis [Stenotrophomonas rhizophila]
MMSANPVRPTTHVRLLAWLRARGWLRSAYHALPHPLREAGLKLATCRLRARARFPRTAAWQAWKQAEVPVVQRRQLDGPIPGINILGYIHGQFGLSEAARSYARALIENGVPVALRDFDPGLPGADGDHALDAYLDPRLPHAISIIFVNPDFLERALAELGTARLKGHYVIACWFWELETLPANWLPSLDLVDEIMVATAFVEQAVKRATDKPVFRVPMPLGAPQDSGLQRADFGLPDDAFTFLASFDFNSRMERKNPEAVIWAFLLAFPPERTDVRLLIKSSNGHRFPHWLKHLLAVAAGDPRIIVRDDVIEREHLGALQRCCDAYVSLHRAEGFGLGLAECMAIGKPVIATGWSGNLEFMNDECAALVEYTLEPVGDGHYPGGEGQRWASVDIRHAASWMRKLVDEPGLARAIGERGREHVARVLSAGNAAQRIVLRTNEIQAARHIRVETIQEQQIPGSGRNKL